jgi:hypothetical protein
MNNKATIISFAYCVFNISFVSIEINFSARNKNRFFCIGTNNIQNAIENAERNSLFKPGFCHALFEEEDFEEEEEFSTPLLLIALLVVVLVVATIFFNTLCAVNNKEAIRSREEERKRV